MTEDFDVVVTGGEPTGICGANARPLSQLLPIFLVINSVSPGWPAQQNDAVSRHR